jgi:hypothetical protein
MIIRAHHFFNPLNFSNRKGKTKHFAKKIQKRK